MALIVADRVLETSTTTGTGAYTLAGAIAGFRAASTVCANGDTFTYYAEDVGTAGNPIGGWETGLGTWGTGGILTRTTIYASSNAGAAVSWVAGTRRIGLAVNSVAALSSLQVNGNINVSGSLSATTKSFLIKHPTKDGMQLRYGSLESPYHGVRLTGEGIITGNSVVIKLPDYISGLCWQDGSQVQITNKDHFKLLCVSNIDISNNVFEVKIDRGLFDHKEYSFYWSFTGIRKDIDPLLVEQ
jgi:hypothetical protein